MLLGSLGLLFLFLILFIYFEEGAWCLKYGLDFYFLITWFQFVWNRNNTVVCWTRFWYVSYVIRIHKYKRRCYIVSQCRYCHYFTHRSFTAMETDYFPRLSAVIHDEKSYWTINQQEIAILCSTCTHCF
jgi:hypothetical protein